MAVASVLDIAVGFPFDRRIVPDILFLVASAVVAWMGIDCLRGMHKKK